MKQGLLFLGLGLISLLNFPKLGSVIDRNRQALLVRQYCLASPNANNTQMAVSPIGEIHDLWFIAERETCRLGEEDSNSLWKAVLKQYPYRLSVIRALYPQSLEFASAAVSIHPQIPEAHNWLAEVLIAQGKTREALVQYLQALALQPRDGATWVQAGRLYEQEGFLTEALQAYEKACDLVDRGKNGCPNAGRLYMQFGLYEQAARRYHQSIYQLPYWPPAKRGLVKALLAQGKTQEALPYLETLAKNGDPEAQETLDQLKNNTGQ